jgi:ABC-2 type transport system permease protein
MNILRRELRANLKSLLIWCVISILFVTVGLSKFAAYEGNPELLVVLDGLPPAVLEAFNLNAFNLTTLTGFFGVMFTYFALILSISATMWGTDIITKEERDKTVEFALTLPVKRSQLITGKALAAEINCLILLLVTWGAMLANASLYQTDSQFFQFVARSMLALLILQLIFLAVGLLLGSAMTHYKRAGSLAIGVLLGAYFLSILVGLSEDLQFLKYFTPFKYFNPADLLESATFEPVYLLLSAGIVAACLAGAYWSYARRDLYI